MRVEWSKSLLLGMQILSDVAATHLMAQGLSPALTTLMLRFVFLGVVIKPFH